MSSEIWSAMEEGLNEIYERFVKDGDLRSREMATLIEKVHPFVVANAARILNSPRFRYTNGDPEGIVQRWWLLMDNVGFKTFDAAKGPLIAYAITILNALCSGENRRGRLRQTQQIPFRGKVPRGGREDRLASGNGTVLCGRQCGAAEKPACVLILKYVLHKSSEERAKCCGLKSVATFNTWVAPSTDAAQRATRPSRLA